MIGRVGADKIAATSNSRVLFAAFWIYITSQLRPSIIAEEAYGLLSQSFSKLGKQIGGMEQDFGVIA